MTVEVLTSACSSSAGADFAAALALVELFPEPWEAALSDAASCSAFRRSTSPTWSL